MHKPAWYAAKALELCGMIVVLVGLGLSISYGRGENGLASMRYEMNGLMIGGGLFAAGWLLERRLGSR